MDEALVSPGRARLLGLLVLVLAAAALVAVRTPATADTTLACEANPSAIFVRLNGVRSDSGSLVAVLYGEDPQDFLKKGRKLATERIPARSGSVNLCLHAPRPGVYAVAVYHDENGNHKFDRSWVGLPLEGFGLSNNPRPLLRMPSHAESAFEVRNGPTVLDIDLRY